MLAACSPRPPIENTEDGLVDPAVWRGRQVEYLERSTSKLHPVVPESLMAHLMRAEADPDFRFDATSVGVDDWANTFAKLDEHRDTSDFDLMRLWVIWHDHRDQLDPELASAMRQRLLDFRYWYTDPAPKSGPDHKWFWSENHKLIIHTMEYLAGRDLAQEKFTITGWDGGQHADRGRRFVTEWLDEKARHGFTEWHSDVYYPEDIQSLLLLAEHAEPDIADRARTMLDVMFLDLAIHQLDGNNGVTHGRSYMKDKHRASEQNVHDIVHFLYGSPGDYRPWADFTTLLLAGTDGYRLPVVHDRIAHSPRTFTDVERMNVPLDPSAEVTDAPSAPPGTSFDDLDSIPFWWERGAMGAWQVAPLTLRAVKEHDLTNTDLFAPYGQLTSLGATPAATQHVARALQCQLNPGLMVQVDTVTHRTPHAMLSSAQDYRAGCLAYQVHAWQATLGPDAVVFTTHPQNEDRGLWEDADRYWNGSASLPRVAQHDSTLISVYSPGYPNGENDTNYLPMTHAFFPTEHFDEVERHEGWTLARKGDGYVALWSWRPTTWAPVAKNPAGLTEPYDLIAEGGATNVWVTEIGDADTYDGFDDFKNKVTARTPQVSETPSEGEISENGVSEFEVDYVSPRGGTLSWGTAPKKFTIDGEPRSLPGSRMTNPFVTVESGDDVWRISEAGASLELDLMTGRREPAS